MTEKDGPGVVGSRTEVIERLRRAERGQNRWFSSLPVEYEGRAGRLEQ